MSSSMWVVHMKDLTNILCQWQKKFFFFFFLLLSLVWWLGWLKSEETRHIGNLIIQCYSFNKQEPQLHVEEPFTTL